MNESTMNATDGLAVTTDSFLNITTVASNLTDFMNTSLENVTVTPTNITTTTLSQLPGCVFQSGKWKCPEDHDISLDAYLIGNDVATNEFGSPYELMI